MRSILLYCLLFFGSLPLVAQETGCTGPTFAQLFRDTTGRYVRLTSVIPYRGSATDLLVGGMADGDVFLSRVDREGNVRWRRSFGTGSESTELTTLNTVIIDAEGMIAGVGNDFHADRQHGFLFRYDPLADRLLYLVQPDLDSELTGIAEAPDNTFFVTGAALDLPPPLFSRALLQRMNRRDGTPAGPATLLDVAGEENPLDLVPHPGGGYLVAGNASLSDGAGSTRALLLRLDEQGEPRAAQVGPVAADVNARLYAFDVEVIGNTTYLLQWGDIGKLTGAENTSAILTAFDPAGLPRWTRRFDLDAFTGETGIELEVSDAGLLIYGFSLDGARDIFLLQVTETGEVVWSKSYSLPGRAQVYQRASQQLLAASNGIWLTATYSFSGTRPHEGLLLRLSGGGESENECLTSTPLSVTAGDLGASWRPIVLQETKSDLSWRALAATRSLPDITTYDDCDQPCERCTTRSFFSQAICAGDSVWVGERWVSVPGILVDTLAGTDARCDSLVVTEVVTSAGPTATYRLVPECGLPSARVIILPAGGIPPYTYTWSDTSITGDRPLLPTGNYVVTVTDRAQCQPFRLAVAVSVPTDSAVALTIRPPSCPGVADGAILLSSPGSGSLKLLRDSVFTPDGLEGLSPGNYSYILRTAAGCEVYREATIPPAAPFSVSITGPNIVRLGNPVSFSASSSSAAQVTYRWSPAAYTDCAACPTTSASFPSDTLLSVIATDLSGCTATDSIRLRIDDSLPRLYVPTAFSPNGDGTNDRWQPGFGPEVSDILEWQVFDRWGRLAWAYDPASPVFWDGGAAGATNTSRAVGPGIYVYRLSVRLINGKTVAVNGEVTVVR